MIENYCPICKAQHEIEAIERSIYDGAEWIVYHCNVTGKEFEMREDLGRGIGTSFTRGRSIFSFTKQSPSTIEPIPEKSAFDLDILDRVHSMISNIASLQKGEGKERYLSQFIKILSQNLNILFIGIHLLDKEKNWLVLQASTPGEISNYLSGHDRKFRIVDHREYSGQAGAALYTGEIRLVHWMTAKIIGYNVVDGKVHEKIVKNYSPLFESPWYGNTELYFPLQNGERKIGALEFTFDTSPWISHTEILKIQALATQLTSVLAEGEDV